MRPFAKIALAAAVAFGAIAPAQAFPGEAVRDHNDGYHAGVYRDRGDWRDNNWGQSHAIRQRIDELQRMVNRNDRRERISEREAAGLRRDVAHLRETYRAMNRDGLSVRESRLLTQRINAVRERLRYERFDRDDRRW